MQHKKLFISLTAVGSVIVFFAVFLMIWFVGGDYKDFESFREEFEIPGLGDGAVPQGMGTCPAEYYVYNEEVDKTEAKIQQYYFISAYMSDGSPSRIYVTGAETGYVGYVTMKTEDGKDFYGHCGGIAINNTRSAVSSTTANYYTLWVTGESMIYCAKASSEFTSQKKTIAQEIVDKAGRKAEEAGNSENYKTIRFTASFEANCNA